MSNAEATNTHKPKPNAFFSERFSDALREGKIENFSSGSPYASAIFPLLKALGWKNISRELIEALPHCAENIDLVDLRNILVNLGYDSEATNTSIKDIKAELYPCLYVTNTGNVFVLLDRLEEQITFHNCNESSKKLSAPVSDLPFNGTSYSFTDNTSQESLQNKSSAGWFAHMASRFKKLLTHLFAMTFVINIAALLVPLFIMLIYDKVIGAKSLESLPLILSGVAILILADLVLRFFRAKMMGAVAGRMDYLIGIETFKQLLYLPPAFSERSSVTAQLSRLKQFESVRNFFTGPTASTVMELPFVILFLVTIAFLAGPIALIPLIMALIYCIFAVLWLPILNKKVLRSGQARTNRQSMLIQTFEGRKEIKAIGGESIWQARFRELSGEAIISNHKSFVTNAIMTNVSQAIMTITGVSVLGFGALSVMEGTMTIGALIATMALVWRALSPIQGAFLSISKFQQTWLAIKQIDQLMRLPVELKSAHSSLMTDDMLTTIKLDRVSFRYSPEHDPVLLGVTFEAKQGETVAIVGFTGSGKSTLLKLIAGMYKPQAGSLLMNNQDIRQLNVMELRRSVAYVPQEVQMFHGTIAQNMRLNNGLASNADLEKAANDAGVLEDIMKMPDGFNSRIGDGSKNKYPPGFLRSIAIARALVSPAKIILLDEPGTSLDFESDQRLMKQISKLKGDRTIIIVSHRPSHIRLADKAVMLDKGTVSFTGDPAEAISIMMSVKNE